MQYLLENKVSCVQSRSVGERHVKWLIRDDDDNDDYDDDKNNNNNNETDHVFN